MRRFDPAQLPTVVDVVIVGGGVTGAAAAREAVARGLSVVLLEKGDFASGTSSRSSKLIHGGLRYLESYQFKLVHESVAEREVMMRIAPHLAQLRPFLYMVYDGYPEQKALINLGLTFYDAFSRAPLGRWHRMLSREAVLRREPGINPNGLRGAGLFHDAFTDDARVTLDTLKSAAETGAQVANYAEVTGFIREHGKVAGVQYVDQLTGSEREIRSRVVASCVGPWTDELRARAGHDAAVMRPTKGVHIIVRKSDYPLNTALFLRSPDDNRVVWPLPALDDKYVYIGTTDTDYRGSVDEVVTTDEDVEYLLNVANAAIPDAKLTADNIVGCWAGLRPLLAPPKNVGESATSREQQILHDDAMVTIAGGKLTTSRIMGRQLIDAVVGVLRDEHGIEIDRRSRTGKTPISGGDLSPLRTPAWTGVRDRIPAPVYARLARRYGGNAVAVAAMADSAADFAAIADSDLCPAEVKYSVRAEAAVSLTDLMVRRTSRYFWSDDAGASVSAACAEIMAAELGWSDAERARQEGEYGSWVNQNRPPCLR